MIRPLFLGATLALALCATACSSCGGPEVCDDKTDNDGDGKVDCDDTDCANDAACKAGGEGEGEGDAGEGEGDAGEGEGEGEGDANVETICDDFEDNDGDDLFDCEDPDCAADTACIEICDNGFDDNFDGFTDCEDPQCDAVTACIEVDCNNVRDDDRNGLIDCADESDCIDAGKCTAGATALGQACTTQNDCQADANDPVCLTDQLEQINAMGFVDSACSEYCDTFGGGCPANSQCFPVDNNFHGVCIPSCTIDADCTRANFVCDHAFGQAVPDSPLVCLESVCGDGVVVREECDDGNTAAGDGCSATCIYDACDATLPALADGDNTGDTTNGVNGVYGSCQLPGGPEDLYTYTPAGSGTIHFTLTSGADMGVHVRSSCHDVSTQLACTDLEFGGDAGGSPEELDVETDGTAPLFVFVDGFAAGEASSYTLNVAFTAAVCGDGEAHGGEQCDGTDFGDKHCHDFVPDTLGTLTCDPTLCTAITTGCVPFTVAETEDNGTTATADDYVDPFVAVQTDGDVDCVQLTTTDAASFLTASVADLEDGRCNKGTLDADIAVFDTDGTTVLASDTGGCSSTSTQVPAGTYFVCVTEQQSTLSPENRYRIVVDTFPLTETEDNGTTATANAYADPFVAVVDDVDVDCVSFDEVAGERLEFRTSSPTGGADACTSFAVDTSLTVFAADGTTELVDSADDNVGGCSTFTATAAASDTIFACVSSAFGETFVYQLTATSTVPVCGDGFIDAGEECDDGNNVAGDGCNDTCLNEECLTPLQAVEGAAGNTGTLTNIDGVENSCSSSFSRSFEQVWEFTPSTSGSVTVTAASATLDLTLGIRTDCGVDASETSCTDVGFTGDAETTTVTVTADTPIFIVVEPFFGGDAGDYTLTIQ